MQIQIIKDHFNEQEEEEEGAERKCLPWLRWAAAVADWKITFPLNVVQRLQLAAIGQPTIHKENSTFYLQQSTGQNISI